ncbi:MAG: protein kinase [Bacteroidetes bacterium]|nr:protein kinase [Bacteroidota bacterium]
MNIRSFPAVPALLWFLLPLVLISSCTEQNGQPESSGAGTDTLHWYRQAAVDLGHRIVMFSAEEGLAVSRGRGREFRGKAYRFRNGVWTPFHEYPYSDYPLIATRDSLRHTAVVNHLTHDGAYRPVFSSFNGDERTELPLPRIMWDAVDHVMMKGIHQFANGTAWMVGQQGHILYFNGTRWAEQPSPLIRKGSEQENAYDGDLNDITMLSERSGWAVGRNGIIVRYQDGQWQRVESPTDKRLFRVRFADERNGFAVGERGTVLRWNGERWEHVQTEVREALHSLAVLGPDDVWVVGAGSTLLHWNGRTWRSETSIRIYEDVLTDISVVRDAGGTLQFWIIGDQGIYTTHRSTGFSFTDITGVASLRRHGRGALFLPDGDDLPRLLLSNEGGTNLLSVNSGRNGATAYTDETERLGLSDAPRDPGMIAAGDVNNDGETDLLQIVDHRVFSFHFGTAFGTFRDAREHSALQLREIDPSVANAARFIDLDNDGDLDLYISNHNLSDQLFRNDGTGRFTDMTDEAGIGKHTGHASYGAVFADVNRDGAADIFIPYYVSYRKKFFDLFLNDGTGRFRRDEQPVFFAGTDIAPTVALTGDFNNDGAPDLFVHTQKAPPFLFINDGTGKFSDKAAASGFTDINFHPDPSNGMAAAADVNNDGWLDLFVGSRLYLNSAGMHFTEVSERVGIQFTGNPVFADIDQDGDQDLFIGSTRASLGKGDRAVLFRNNLDPQQLRTLTIHPDRSNRTGDGVVITACGWSTTLGSGGSPMFPAISRRIILPSHLKDDDTVVVRFPSGVQQQIRIGHAVDVYETGIFMHPAVLGTNAVRRAIYLLDLRDEMLKLAGILSLITLGLFLFKKKDIRTFARTWQMVTAGILTYICILLMTAGGSTAVSAVLPVLTVPAVVLIGSFVLRARDLRRRSQYIAHYRLGPLIGQGGMGKVYRATDTLTKRSVALKVLHPELTADPENKRRLKAEGELLSSFDHPNIVKVFAIGESEGRGYIAMEFLPGGTLKERLTAEHPLPLERIKEYIGQVCDGLQEVHRHGTVHRDLKTGNLMLGEKGRVRLMDFGLSKSPLVTTMTSLGTVLGTLGYVAPEQVTGGDVDARTDIFSLGVIMYELLTNRLPFNGENEIALIHAIFNTVPPPPSSLRPDLPAGWDAVVMKCLARDTAERYGSAEQVAEELQQWKV